MEINWLFLGWFVLYLLIVLGIGVWGWKQITTQADFAIAGQSLGLLLGVGTMFASFMSALTVIGGVGYASEFGFAFLTLFSVGSVLGMGFLALTAKYFHSTGVNSLSELMGMRYNSQFLRAAMTAVVVVAYGVVLIAQLFGVGFIIEGIIGVPMWLGILTVGLFFVIYTILGGMVALARTDLFQAFVMALGVLIMFFAMVRRLLADPERSFVDAQTHFTVYAGETPDNVGLLAMILVFGLGVAIHPYYVQRVMSAKDVKTARLIPGINALLLIIFYIIISITGIIGFMYLPEQTGDAMAPAMITELIGGTLGAIAMMAILAGVQSTTDSLLHIVGAYVSQDIYEPYVAGRELSPQETLRWSRIFTAIFGVVVVSVATIQVLTGELELIAVVGAYAWSILGGSLFVAVAAGLFWKGATRQGALASVGTGFVIATVGVALRWVELIEFDPIFPAFGGAIVAMVVVSLLTEPVDDEVLAQIFDDVEARPGVASDD